MLKIKCSKCGAEKGTTKVRYDKLVAKFGSVEELGAQYLCRACRPKDGKADAAEAAE